jgi:hypothetical protein
MTTLVLGGSGATGKQLVAQLLKKGEQVKVIVRSSGNLPGAWQHEEKLSIIKANISEVSVDEMANYLKGCRAVASCLGHNLTLKGMYGPPRMLVTNAVRLLCDAIEKNSAKDPVKVVLMNTTGNRNRNLNEPISFGQRFVVGLLRMLLPPHRDNENAADHLRLEIGQDHPLIQWLAVRPDNLIDENGVTEYELYFSPTRSAIFNPGKTSRINVGHFMARLIAEDELWNKWKGQMPVIYNRTN